MLYTFAATPTFGQHLKRVKFTILIKPYRAGLHHVWSQGKAAIVAYSVADPSRGQPRAAPRVLYGSGGQRSEGVSWATLGCGHYFTMCGWCGVNSYCSVG